MATKLYLAQRTNRHVVKRLDASSVFETMFGSWGTPKSDNTGLDSPWAIAADPSDNIYVCDGYNKRIVKLNSSLGYDTDLDISTEIGRPHTIFYDSVSTDLYVVGIKNYLTVSIARILTSLTSVSKFSSNIYAADTNDQPMGISADFTSSYFLISGMNDLLKVEETGGGFNTAVIQGIVGEAGTKFIGHVKHSNGDLYLLSNRFNGSSISRVNSSYTNIGDSDKVSRATATLTEGLSGNLLFIDNQGSKVVKYDANLNFVADVYAQADPLPSPPENYDSREIYGIIEIDV